jgi:hypothetical protein
MSTTDFYQQQRSTLLRNHDKLLANGLELLNLQYGDAVTQSILTDTRLTFDLLIPQIPYIGGKTNPLTDTLVQMTSLLALYRVLEARDVPVSEIGALVHKMATFSINRFPALMKKILGHLYMSRFWRTRTQKLALESQRKEFAGNFVYEVVQGNSDSYEWGINYVECAVVKFFHEQDADEFTPYMCFIDFLMFSAMGLDLERQGTIANGCTHCDFRFKEYNQRHNQPSGLPTR